MNQWVVEAKGLTKKYGDLTAVDKLNLKIKPGEVFGLLGPNGAGKTTTILMILGLTEPTSGTVHVLGFDPARQPLSVKSRVGYLPDQVGFYEELSAIENLTYIARLNGLSRQSADHRIEDALARVGLTDVADHRVATYSRGMRQRLGVADILIKQPQLIILDEPTQGLDPEGAHEFLDLIRTLKSEGITVLLSSHLLYQVQAVCDRVGLFSHGRMVLEGSVPELARKVLGRAYRIHLQVEGGTDELTHALKAVPGVVSVHPQDTNAYEVETEHDLRPEVAQAVISAGGRLLRLDAEAQSLDDIYEHYFKEAGNVHAN
ncbi:MAG: ABC transporter ATP-binding protein [Chloroflexi bacterium]|nr:ABC transporter ATP-binding protein [Chloroflexota bacterium]